MAVILAGGVIAVVLFILALLLVSTAVGWGMVRYVTSVLESDFGPLEKPTPAALGYSDKLGIDVLQEIGNGELLITCSITNRGERQIRQMVLHLSLSDNEGNEITWTQGPLIGKIPSDRWVGIFHVRGEERVGFAWNPQATPIAPGGSISFSKRFPVHHESGEVARCKVIVMDIEFE